MFLVIGLYMSIPLPSVPIYMFPSRTCLMSVTLSPFVTSTWSNSPVLLLNIKRPSVSVET